MKNQKGFTLIQLLLILLIIALIVIFIFVKFIKKAKLTYVTEDALALRKAANLFYSASLIENIEFNGISFICNGKKCISDDKKELKIDGTIPSKGTIVILPSGVVNYDDIRYDKYVCNIPNIGDIECLNINSLLEIEFVSSDSTFDSITIYFKRKDDKKIICEYGIDEKYGKIGTIIDDTCVINKLEPNTKYYYKITVTDKNKNNRSIIGDISTLEKEE